MLEAIRRRVAREGLRNVRTVRGAAADPRLPPRSVEAVLIVDAYHEFGNPVALLRGIAAALKPGGRVGVVNFDKTGGGPGPPRDERVDEARVIEEAKSAGLELLRKETFLPFQVFPRVRAGRQSVRQFDCPDPLAARGPEARWPRRRP